ncbi:hypothetical protein D3C80_1950560 [compost metagenome]
MANGIVVTVDQKIIDAVLEGTARPHAIQFGEVGLVVAEQPLAVFLAPGAGLPVGELRVSGQNLIAPKREAWLLHVRRPTPGVTSP